ncbi:MAG: Type 1 glutamine amidotransferase-like domain-containing protein [Chloroflexota bacterium]
MIGPLALHGGGEFLAGDEPFLRAILELAAGAAAERQGPSATVHIELLTTAVARHRPEAAFAVGSAALERVAAEADLRPIEVGHARVVDAASAADPAILDRLGRADIVYLPGGDPGVVVDILGGSAALRAVEAARTRGAVVAGASAGAMALGEQTWTPDGWVEGFGWAGRLVVVPHAIEARLAAAREELDRQPGGRELAIAGLPERAGIIGQPGNWTVAGAVDAWWWPSLAATPRMAKVSSVIRE